MTIFLTGATDGIGLALAKLYHRQGRRLVLLGRRSLPTLDDPLFQAESVCYCQVDLSQPDCAEQVQACLRANNIGPLSLLIHNAGLGYYGATAEQSADSITTLTAVNLLAPLRLTHALLPQLREHPQPKIVFISSVVTALPCPEYAVYGATKAALDGLARNLRLELRDAVAVQVIHPGATRTGMHPKSGMSRAVVDWEKFPAAESVAMQIAGAIESRQTAVTIGLTNKILRGVGYYFATLVDYLQRRKYR